MTKYKDILETMIPFDEIQGDILETRIFLDTYAYTHKGLPCINQSLIRDFHGEGIWMHGYDCLMHDMLVWDYGKKSYEYIQISENLLHQSYKIIYGIPSGS